MADNVDVTPGVGASIATDDVGGVQFQKVKIDLGGDGVSSPLTDVGMPISGAGSDYAPQYGPPDSTASLPAQIDPAGQLMVRGLTMTDEGGYRCNFANSSLAVSIGTCTFTNGSPVVTGTSFSTADVHVGNYVYLNADGITAQAQVSYLTDTEITLSSNYTGAGGTGASSRQIVKSVVGAGGSIVVSSGQATIAAQTTASSVFELEREVDYLPIVKETKMSISQRIANQDIYLGFYDENESVPKWYTWFHFTGTTNTAVNCVCAWNPTTAPSGGEIVTQTVTLPAGVTSADSNTYRIELLKDRVLFYCNEIIMYTERRIVPHPHALQASTLRVVNGTTPATNTNVVVDYDACSNFNVVSTENPSKSMEITNPNVPSTEVVAFSQAGVIAINTVLATFDASQFRAYVLQTVSMGTTGVVTVQHSLDNGTTWGSVAMIPLASGTIVTTHNSSGTWVFPGSGGIIRLRLTTATTAGTTTIRVRGLHQVPPILMNTVTLTGAPNVTVSGGAAHDAAISGNPTRIAGRAITANYATVATGDTADFIATLQGVQIIKPWQIPELEYNVHDRITASSTTAVQVKAATASLKNFVNGFTLATDTLGAAGDIQLRSTPVASTTATISANTLVMAATYGWKVGDLVLVTASTVTGLSAGSYYYLLTVSGASLTFSATRGGATSAISGTGVVATLTKIIWRTKLQTASLPLSYVPLANPDSGGTGLAIEMVLPSSLTSGQIDFSVTGHVAP